MVHVKMHIYVIVVAIKYIGMDDMQRRTFYGIYISKEFKLVV